MAPFSGIGRIEVPSLQPAGRHSRSVLWLGCALILPAVAAADSSNTAVVSILLWPLSSGCLSARTPAMGHCRRRGHITASRMGPAWSPSVDLTERRRRRLPVVYEMASSLRLRGCSYPGHQEPAHRNLRPIQRGDSCFFPVIYRNFKISSRPTKTPVACLLYRSRQRVLVATFR